MVTILEIVVVVVIVGIMLYRALEFQTDRLEGQIPRINLWKLVGGGVLLVLFLALIAPNVGEVEAGHRGVVLRFGAVTGRVLDEGIYVVMPLAERVVHMSVQVQAEEVEAAAASRDLQEVKTKVTLNYSPDPLKAAEIYQKLRHEAVVRIIRPAVQESVKAATAHFNAEQLITERPTVKGKIEDMLRVRLNEHGFGIDAVNITDFEFSRAFNDAIEAKVTATQLADKAERDLQRVKMEAQQQIERAKAEAEALRVQKEQVTAELIELRRIEAQMKALEKWNGDLPQVVAAGGAGSPVPILDLFRQFPIEERRARPTAAQGQTRTEAEERLARLKSNQ